MADKDFSSITGLPEDLGIDSDLGRAEQRLSIRTDSRRYGKPVTIVSGLDPRVTDLKALAKTLKQRLACGGTVEGDEIELQGSHESRAREILTDLGFVVD